MNPTHPGPWGATPPSSTARQLPPIPAAVAGRARSPAPGDAWAIPSQGNPRSRARVRRNPRKTMRRGARGLVDDVQVWAREPGGTEQKIRKTVGPSEGASCATALCDIDCLPRGLQYEQVFSCSCRLLRLPVAPFAPPRVGGRHFGLGENHPWPISGVLIAEPRRSVSPPAVLLAARPSPFMMIGENGSVSVAVGDATSIFPDRKPAASGAAQRSGTYHGGLQQRRRSWFFSWVEEGCSWPGPQGSSPPPTPPSQRPRHPGERLPPSPRCVPPRRARTSRWIPWRPLWMGQDRRSPPPKPISRLRIPNRAACGAAEKATWRAPDRVVGRRPRLSPS